MEINFNEQNHIYMINGEVANTSVTRLLAKHHLANDYTGVDADVLQRKASYGTNVHKDIEKVITEKDYVATTKEGELFKAWALNNLSGAVAEQLVGIDYNGLTIGGSIDLLGFLKAGKPIIADHKTYAKMDNRTKLHIAWQLSIYDYMARHIDNVNGVKLNWLGAKQFEVLWYHKNEQEEIILEEIVVDKIDDAEIENLFNAEIKGETYRPRELIIASELELKLQQAEIELAKRNLEIKKYENDVKAYREQLKDMMEKQNILNWKSPNGVVSISYVSAYTKGTVDSKKLQKERPDIYNAYLKTSNVKSTIKVSVDEEKLKELQDSGAISRLEYQE